jgi:hypothetical protein
MPLLPQRSNGRDEITAVEEDPIGVDEAIAELHRADAETLDDTVPDRNGGIPVVEETILDGESRPRDARPNRGSPREVS